MRAAVYYAPKAYDPLWQAGSVWLGRDAESGGRLPSPQPDDVTAEPRLYGFHATLKPPMRLLSSWWSFLDDVRILAASLQPFELPPLQVTALGQFLALREARSSAALQALADCCVERLDHHRTPAEPAERERRRQAGLSPAQEAMLERWGYPHVFTTWRFHMTLTRRLTVEEHTAVRPLAEQHFAPALALTRMVEELCIFTQASAGAPFLLAERVPLG